MISRLNPLTIFSLLFLLFLSFQGYQKFQVKKTIQISLWEFPRWKRNKDASDRFYWIKKKIAEFEQANQGVHIKLVELSWKGGGDKLKIAVAANSPPDICAGILPVNFIRQNLIEPLDNFLPYAERKNFSPAALDACSFGNRLYCMPWYIQGCFLFSNKELGQKLDLLLPESFTLKQFEEILVKAKKNTTDINMPGFFPFIPYFASGDYANWPFIIAKENYPGLNNRYLFDIQNNRTFELIRNLRLWKEKGLIPEDSGGIGVPDVWKSFAKEKRVLFSAFGTWAIPALRRYGVSFKVHFYPAHENKQQPSFIACSGFYIFKQKEPKKRELCARFIRFLTNEKNQQVLKKYGVFPSRSESARVYKDDPLMLKCFEVLANGKNLPVHPAWSSVDETVNKTFQSSLAGKKSIDTLLHSASERIKNLVLNSEKEKGENWTYLLGVPSVIFLLLLFLKFILDLKGFTPLQRRTLLLFFLPFMFLTIFYFFPILFGFLLSFKFYQGSAGLFENFVGLENYRRVLMDPVFYQSLKNTFFYTFIVVPLNLGTALLIAALIFPLAGRSKGFFRGAFYLPGVASAVVISIIWRYLFDFDMGLFNYFLGLLSVSPVKWLTSEEYSFISVIMTAVFRSPGGPIIIYLAAMDSLPVEYFEAAKIEGATNWQTFLYVILPSLKRTTLFLIVTMTIDSFQVFAQVLMLTDGGPGFSSTVLVHRIYTTAFRDLDMGFAAAMSFILFIIIAFFSSIQYFMLEERGT
ncbi:extracellular solute-binding protein [Candidatus Riflebacteria bacterium]